MEDPLDIPDDDDIDDDLDGEDWYPPMKIYVRSHISLPQEYYRSKNKILSIQRRFRKGK